MAPACTQTSAYVAVKVPVFCFEKLTDVDTPSGPGDEIHRRGAGALPSTLDEALVQGPDRRRLPDGEEPAACLLTVRDTDKHGDRRRWPSKFARAGLRARTPQRARPRCCAAGGLPDDGRWSGRSTKPRRITADPAGKRQDQHTSSPPPPRGGSPPLDSVKIRRKAVERASPA